MEFGLTTTSNKMKFKELEGIYVHGPDNKEKFQVIHLFEDTYQFERLFHSGGNPIRATSTEIKGAIEFYSAKKTGDE